MLRLKEFVNPEELRRFGFEKGSEHFGKERWCGNGAGYEYQKDWYHKFLRVDWDTAVYGEQGEIAYTSDEYDIPMIHMAFRIGSSNDLYIDCAPCGTYHIGGSDLHIITDTIFKLVEADCVEYISEEKYE